jgi:hypothetical protein
MGSLITKTSNQLITKLIRLRRGFKCCKPLVWRGALVTLVLGRRRNGVVRRVPALLEELAARCALGVPSGPVASAANHVNHLSLGIVNKASVYRVVVGVTVKLVIVW